MKRWRAWWRDYRIVLAAGGGSRAVAGVALMMIAAAALDLLGVGLVAPFVALVLGQSIEMLPQAIRATAQRISLEALGVTIVVVFLLKALLQYRLHRGIIRFSEARRAGLMARLLRAYLAKPYAFHLERAPSTLINTLFWHTAHYAGSTLAASLRLATDVLVLVSLTALLWTMSPLATATLVLFLGGVFAAVSAWVRREYANSARQLADAQREALVAAQNAIGAYREIRVLGAASVFESAARTSAARIADAASRQNALNTVPKGAVETALVAFLVLLALLSRSGALASELLAPVLGAMAVAALRLVPVATSLLGNVNNLRASRLALAEIARDLREPDVPRGASESSPAPAIDFRRIELDGVAYRYPGAARQSLEAVDLVIHRGEVLGLRGRSGAGKSTLVDLLLGLLEPMTGRIRADGQAVSLAGAEWQHRCAYIPQEVFLIDGTIADNILFGAPRDPARLKQALALSRVDAFVSELPQGLESQVGEGGSRLSGGQRQRIAIARALYHDRDVLILDEATSALDAQTEAEVLAALATLRGRRTIVLVAHRERMLEACDRVIELADGRILSEQHRVATPP